MEFALAFSETDCAGDLTSWDSTRMCQRNTGLAYDYSSDGVLRYCKPQNTSKTPWSEQTFECQDLQNDTYYNDCKSTVSSSKDGTEIKVVCANDETNKKFIFSPKQCGFPDGVSVKQDSSARRCTHFDASVNDKQVACVPGDAKPHYTCTLGDMRFEKCRRLDSAKLRNSIACEDPLGHMQQYKPLVKADDYVWDASRDMFTGAKDVNKRAICEDGMCSFFDRESPVDGLALRYPSCTTNKSLDVKNIKGI